MTQQGTTAKLPLSIKAAVLITAAAFLGYCIYWLVQGVIWGYNVTFMLLHINQISLLHSMGATELVALFVQEYCSAANSFVLLLCGVFAFQSAIRYVKGNQKYLGTLRWALVLLAVFSLLLVPSSLHHLFGVALGWSMVNIYVGLSYLIQALLIVPPLIMLSQKMRLPQNPEPIKKWVYIAAPAYAFALYFKYLFLWVDTLVPMGPTAASAATWLGAANSLLTLLFAGAVMAVGCFAIARSKPWGKKLVAAAILLLGAFLVAYSLVAFFVPVYMWFWWLTDFWMLTLPLLGVALLLSKRSSS